MHVYVVYVYQSWILLYSKISHLFSQSLSSGVSYTFSLSLKMASKKWLVPNSQDAVNFIHSGMAFGKSWEPKNGGDLRNSQVIFF